MVCCSYIYLTSVPSSVTNTVSVKCYSKWLKAWGGGGNMGKKPMSLFERASGYVSCIPFPLRALEQLQW